ncbi:MAG TPA: histidine phosphatase family protein [Thermomicrobiales bacterium]|nr:histidine phosphatase family protein [Thermomicrobiales bacterium]
MELLIVQHADIPHIWGNPGLSPLGFEHAGAIGRWLHRQRPIDLLFSSPLRRARETAEQIALESGKATSDIRVDHRLRERMNWLGATAQEPGASLAQWHASFADREMRLAGAETSLECGERMAAFVTELRERHEGRRIVAVSHGGATVDLALTMWGAAAIRRRSPKLLDEGPMPCAVTRIQTQGEHLVLYSIGTQYMLR